MIGDMPADGWIDRFAPVAARPYLKLMRLDRPIGTWLLLFPSWWAIALGAGWADASPLYAVWLMVLFGVGALVMRGAGCTINDILDRDIDGKVARTAARPLASGEISVRQALVFLGFELLIGLMVLIQLNRPAIMLGLCALLLVAVYPLMKRLTYWPQAWLGLTFNFGAIVGWAAVTGGLHWPVFVLYAAGICWTLGYDTIYAHQDKDDDIQIGVKSSALALGKATRPFVAAIYSLEVVLIGVAGAWAGLGSWFYLGLVLGAGHLMWQVVTLDIDNGRDCLGKFKSNRLFGAIILAAVAAGQL